MVRVLAVAAIVFSLGMSSAADPLQGQWRGLITADIGQMLIEVTVKVEGAKASGEVKTGHGAWKITDGRFAEGRWTLTFTTPDGEKGEMVGAVKVVEKVEEFSGDWKFAPRAVGTFKLQRVVVGK